MGGAHSSSSGNGSAAGQEAALKDLENKLRGAGDLGILERAFSYLSASSSSDAPSASSPAGKPKSVSAVSLQTALGLAPISIEESAYPELSKVVAEIGPAIGKEFFDVENGTEISWPQLLHGFEKCGQTSGGKGLQSLFSVYSQASQMAKGSQSSKVLEKVPREGSGTYFEMVGYLTGAQLRDFLLLCWLFMCSAKLPLNVQIPKVQAYLPKIDALLSGAVSACDVSKSKEPSSEQDGLDKDLPIAEICPWILSTIPGLSDSLLQYIRAKMERLPFQDSTAGRAEDSAGTEHAAPADSEGSEEKGEQHETLDKSTMLLQSGVAWAIGLSLKDTASETLFRASCGLINSPESEYPNLLYRSSIHGKGMNRFWSCVEGYRGPTLLLVSAHITDENIDNNSHGKAFILGALIAEGFDNKESFYGSTGSCLYALDPAILPIHSTGREKNFVYSHKNAPGAGYRAKPMPEGIGFGGSLEKERIWLTDDFGTLTVRHHANDKTYQAGSLVPDQGYASVISKVVDLEVWGLGGKKADNDQAAYLKRANLFSEQRRKVDLKTMFGTWENSPEKMMMDMVSNPNKPQREER